MVDVVVRLPVREGEEAQLFGDFLTTFIERFSSRAELWAAKCDAPYVMVRSDPQQQGDLKVLTFQEPLAAREFSSGWDKARTQLTAQVTYLMS